MKMAKLVLLAVLLMFAGQSFNGTSKKDVIVAKKDPSRQGDRQVSDKDFLVEKGNIHSDVAGYG